MWHCFPPPLSTGALWRQPVPPDWSATWWRWEEHRRQKEREGLWYSASSTKRETKPAAAEEERWNREPFSPSRDRCHVSFVIARSGPSDTHTQRFRAEPQHDNGLHPLWRVSDSMLQRCHIGKDAMVLQRNNYPWTSEERTMISICSRGI